MYKKHELKQEMESKQGGDILTHQIKYNLTTQNNNI